jgi:hypothetical protein
LRLLKPDWVLIKSFREISDQEEEAAPASTAQPCPNELNSTTAILDQSLALLLNK